MVKVVEISRVPPTPGRPESAGAPERLPLTFFDILWLRFPPVQYLFFYELPETDSLHDSVVPRLKNSLSLTLRHYLPLAGHLVWPEESPKPVIDYLDGDGVSFAVAESDDGSLDFDALSGDGFFRAAAECLPLVPRLASSRDKAEAIAIQVTLFPGSGFCVGLASHHAILDGKTWTAFFKSWAKTCRGDEYLAVDRPVYDRTALVGDPAGLEAVYLDAWLNDDDGPDNRSLKIWESGDPLPPDSVRATFSVAREEIERLRKSLNDPAVSTFSLVSGYTSVCYAKATRAARGLDRSAVAGLGINANFRAQLRPALPAEYFGNCVGGGVAAIETRVLLGDAGVIGAAGVIHNAVKSLGHGDDVLAGAESYASVVVGEKAKFNNSGSDVAESLDDNNKGSAMLVVFAGSPSFEVYSADFGFGRPKKAEMVSIDRTGAICLSDSKDGNGGIEVGLVLKRDEMEAFAFEFLNGIRNLHKQAHKL